MDEEDRAVRKNKREKGSMFLPAGSLASLANQMSLRGTKRNVQAVDCSNREKQVPRLRSQVQTQVQQEPIHSTSLVEQVQQVPRHSTASAAQTVLGQVQQESRHPTPYTAQAVQEQVQQTSQDSTPQEANQESEEQENVNTNRENRKKLRYPHTVAKKSFAVIREEKKKEGPDVVTNKAIFVTTRKRKPGQAEMERVQTQESEDGVDAFAAVMGPDHPGHQKMEEMEARMQKMQEKFDAQTESQATE
ncbi:uncharacterized protein LOC132611992 [Lycium barbarum]|uniref:uncharacterized protein LOC132611992 n=1 Tax=Lycium barbarum TaxID=112863 RepID=UPI00293E6BCB|nr:uncharacterized protein LOC132611992 [Lycium barbarum]